MYADRTAIQTPGFADPVADAQRVFRAALEALARPTLPQAVGVALAPPAPLGRVIAALALTLCDEQTPVWLDAALRTPDVTAWIRFHTGARIVDVAEDAAFCLASSPAAAPAPATMNAGTDEEPHLSATVIVDATGAAPLGGLVVTGPGVNGSVDWDGAGLPWSVAEWNANAARFPRGVDLLIAGAAEVRGLPRTTRLKGRS